MAVWGVSVAAGHLLLLEYGVTSGRPAEAPRRWPEQAQLLPPRHRPLLLLVAHPRCSCTRASLAELARLMSDLQGALDARVLFVRPDPRDEDFHRTDLWRRSGELDGVEAVLDDGGREAARFGAWTSGQVLLYDTDGDLLFSGGLTSTRGHEGPSVGYRRIVELVRSGTTDRAESTVFGCPLRVEGFDLGGRSILERFEFADAIPGARTGPGWCGASSNGSAPDH